MPLSVSLSQPYSLAGQNSTLSLSTLSHQHPPLPSISTPNPPSPTFLSSPSLHFLGFGFQSQCSTSTNPSLPPMLPLFLLFPLLFLFSAEILAQSSFSPNDVSFLLEFKKGIHRDPLGSVLTTWNLSSLESDGCPANWHGIECQNGSVTAIHLDSLSLVGDLKFFTLNGLKNLQNLSLSNNNLTGRLVPAIGTMVSLRHLDLSQNNFYGPIPRRITELWNLVYLNLSSNGFVGWFPLGLENLQQLKVLDLSSNNLSGDIGSALSMLRNPGHVDFSCNGFYGALLFDSVNFSSLVNTVQHLNLSRNRLAGPLGWDGLGSVFQNLKVLDVSYNQLGGELPSFDSLHSIQVLRLGSNQFSGSIPAMLFGSSMGLTEIDLSYNKISDSIVNINSTTLKFLNLSSNAVSGSLPTQLGSCVVLDLSRNLISGDLSAMQTWGDTVEFIDLSSNTLSGSFPNQTSQFLGLTSIKLRNNSLVGVLPTVLGSYSKLTLIDLSLNQLSGSILSSLFTSPTLKELHLSGNHFTGTIPLQSSYHTEALALPQNSPLESLDLSDNLLVGSLSQEVGNLNRLKLLNLRKNSLSGQIPNEISKLSGLEVLDLSVNNFKGPIPDDLPQRLTAFNVSYNELSGPVPGNLSRFPNSSFRPGNDLLIFGIDPVTGNKMGHHGRRKSRVLAGIIAGSIVGVFMMIVIFVLIHYRQQLQEFGGSSGFHGSTTRREIKFGRHAHPSLFGVNKDLGPAPKSMSFSTDHLLTLDTRSSSGQKQFTTEVAEQSFPGSREVGPESSASDVLDGSPNIRRKSSPGSQISTSHFESCLSEQRVILNVYSPDRFAGDLFFLDSSVVFTAEELSRAPAEVLGRSSHGTSYKATLDSGFMLTVKWLRETLVKRQKEFAKEAKRIGTIRHPNVVSLRGYYWGPRGNDKLILSDYITAESLALHLYGTTPGRKTSLSFNQRLKIAIDIARCLFYLHQEKNLPHGNLKPSNILLAPPDFTAKLTDYGLHRLMTTAGTADQILNLGALGYRAPELASATKPLPSFKADVYAFGVILMELITRKSAGDIISVHSGAVDLTDWVRMRASRGQGVECYDGDIIGSESDINEVDDLLAISLRCVRSANERPDIRTVFEELSSLAV